MGMTKEAKVRFSNSRRSKFTVRIESYKSAMEVAQECESREVRHSEYDLSHREFTKDWQGVESYEEALDLLRNGYQPVVEKLQDSLKANRQGTSKRMQFENQVHGFAPIVPLALKGVPNSMINMTIKPIKCKVIDIYYDMGVPAYLSSDNIIKAGQKLLATIIGLEKEGYRFNLYALQAFSSDTDAGILCVKVKSSDKPIDLKRMSTPLTHPAFFRVIGFDWQGKSPITKYRGSGRGQALTTNINDKQSKEFASQVWGDNAVYISCNSIHNKDEEYIREVLI